MKLAACNDDRPRRLRRPEEFAGERGGYAPWCGPAAVATAAGVTYASACALLARVAPERYPPGREIVTAWWRDLVAALDLAGVPAEAFNVEGKPTLSRAVREGLPEGWWLARVTDHFCLLEVARRGTARVYDNRLHAVPLSAKTHGRRRVTHLARVPAPPGAE
ncbi:hypothetical protein [Falsiroseomonas oryziterrae]|uniref:hypothetical protein n=1 Tax=Falsiroseomonas oryziterrae TaxID=2911368 RepID=UPI001F4787B1|nr:hypothetical protein [Roseomonas sp. NPKOSM-4]